MLEDPRAENVLAVVDRVDLDLEAGEVLVDQARRLRPDRGRGLGICGELTFVVDDLHPAAAQDVRRADEDRKTELASYLACLAKRVRRSSLRTRDAEPL